MQANTMTTATLSSVPTPRLSLEPINPMETLEQIVAGASDLATLPQIVLRVISLTDDPKAAAPDLEKLIAMDQALAVKILALANSSYYGLPRRVSSLREAIIFLGFRTLREMATTLSTSSLFLGRGDVPALARRALWRHSIDAAQCARVVVGLLSPDVREAVGAEQAYTAALLHDIGKAALDRSRHALFVALVRMAELHRVRYSVIEAEAMLFTHGQIGGAMATRWNLPASLVEAIAFHHTPGAATLNPKLTATVCLANEIARFLETAPASPTPDALALLHQTCRDALMPLRVSEECFHSMIHACRVELAKGLSGMGI